MGHRVTAGYVTVPTAVEGGSVAHIDIPFGSVLPEDVPAEFVDALLARGHIERTDEDPEGPGVDTNGDGIPEGSALQVLKWVAGDPEKAARAIESEQGKEKPRTTLITELNKLVPAE